MIDMKPEGGRGASHEEQKVAKGRAGAKVQKQGGSGRAKYSRAFRTGWLGPD